MISFKICQNSDLKVSVGGGTASFFQWSIIQDAN